MDFSLMLVINNALAATVIALAAAALGRLRPRRPALIHAVWMIALLKLVAPPLFWIPVPAVDWLGGGSSDHITVSRVEPPVATLAVLQEEPLELEDLPLDSPSEVDLIAATRPVFVTARQTRVESWSLDWRVVVLVGMAAGAFSIWTLAAVRIARFERLLHRDGRPAPAEWRDQAGELAAVLRLSRCPRVVVAPGRVPLMLWWGYGRLRLIVPAELFETLGRDERAALLLHELAHYKRGDHWMRWFELAVCGLYWWHPGAWWMRRGLREAEEECCDAWVVWARPEGAKTYANALLAAMDFVSSSTPVAAASALGGGRGSLLKRRFCMIMQAKTSMRLHGAGRLAVVACAVLFLPLAPTWARQERPPAPTAPDEPLPPPDLTPRETPEPDDELKSRDDHRGADRDRIEALPGRPHDPKNDPRRARGDDDLARAARELQNARREVAVLQQRLSEAMSKLEKLEGGRRPGKEPRDPSPKGALPPIQIIPRGTPAEPPQPPDADARGSSVARVPPARPAPGPQPPDADARGSSRPYYRLVPRGKPSEPPLSPDADARGRVVPLGQPQPPTSPDQPGGMAEMMPRMSERQMRMMGERRADPAGGGHAADQDRRLRELESKMDRLLKELGELKKSQSPGRN